MKVQYNDYAAASGSRNGNTYSRNRVSNYIRNRTKPLNPFTLAKAWTKNVLATIAGSWISALTDAERTAWNDRAAEYIFSNGVNGTYVPTGFQLYQTENINAVLLSTGTSTTPPAKSGDTFKSALSAVYDISAGTLNIAWTSTTITQKAKIFFTPPVSSGLGLGSLKNKFRMLRSQTTQVPVILTLDGTPVSETTAYNEQFGTALAPTVSPPTGTTIWLKLVAVRLDNTDEVPVYIPVTVQA